MRQSPCEAYSVSISAIACGVGEGQIDVLPDARFHALHFFLAGRLLGQVLHRLEQDLAGFVQVLVGAQLARWPARIRGRAIRPYPCRRRRPSCCPPGPCTGGRRAHRPARRRAPAAAASSGWSAAGMWYIAMTYCVSPTRRNVTERSPSCAGSMVYGCFQRALRAAESGRTVRATHASALVGIELAGHGQQRVVGLVILLVERRQLLDGHILDVGLIADGRMAVGVPDVGGLAARARTECCRGRSRPPRTRCAPPSFPCRGAASRCAY